MSNQEKIELTEKALLKLGAYHSTGNERFRAQYLALINKLSARKG
jgi:hypothetical protein